MLSNPEVPFERGSRQRPALERALVLAAVAAIGVFYFWTADNDLPASGLNGERSDYYNLLSHGFLDGHLSMKVAPLAEPIKEADRVVFGRLPWLLDASFYEGKYYLYFGPTPVLAAFLPYRVLTGNDISENLVAAAFAVGGFLVSVVLLGRVRRRFFPGAAWWLMPLFVVLVGLGNGCAAMLRHPLFYEVAIACAFFFQSLFLLGLYQSLTAETGRARCGWVALASLACGLSVGARASGAFGSLALMLALAWWWRQHRHRGGSSFRALWPLAMAAIGPIALCAVGLMIYNYQRFGRIFEFGITYQFSLPTTFSLQFLAHNLKLYYFSLPALSWYFPFVLPISEGIRPPGYDGIEQIHGQIWSAVLFVPVLAAAGLLWSRRFGQERPLSVFWTCAFFVYLNNLMVVLCIGGRASRYVVDFQPLFLLLGSVALLAWERELPWTAWRRRWAGCGLGLIVALIALHNIFTSLQLYELFKAKRPGTYEKIATTLNAPTGWVGRWLYPRLGPVRLRAQFPAGHQGEIEPLVVTGSAEYCDFLLVQYLGTGWIRFVLMHIGYPDVASAPIEVGVNRPHDIEIDLGSLYPPLAHPFFEPFSRGERRLIKRAVRVTVDGQPVFTTQQDFHDASPSRVHVGENPLAPLYTGPRFSGTITNVRRAGLTARLERNNQEQYGAVALQLIFPFDTTGRLPEPLVVTGERGQGAAVFVKYDDARHFRFGCDRWDSGPLLSDPVELDPHAPHLLEIWMGTLLPPKGDLRFSGLPAYELDRLKNLVRVNLDGREVFQTRLALAEADPHTVEIGNNSVGMPGSGGRFGGSIMDIRRLPVPTAADWAKAPVLVGPVRMRVVFPAGQAGRSEPLITTGRAGAGDVVFVTYIDARTVRFSLDHGSGELLTSGPVPIDYAAVHDLEFDLGSFYPAEGLGPLSRFAVAKIDQRRKRLQLRIDGQKVWNVPAEFHPAMASEISVGRNPIGAVTCAPAFSGLITEVVRPGYGSARPPRRTEDYGPVRMELALPKGRTGQSEPLLVTGRTGAADALIITYADDRHIRLTWDHWGRGGPTSALLAADYDEPQLLEVEMGSFYPEDSAAMKNALGSDEVALRRSVLDVKLDGQKVLAASGTFHPAKAEEMQFGSNQIGLSSAVDAFSGSIEWLERPGVPAAGR